LLPWRVGGTKVVSERRRGSSERERVNGTW
jgi:hypothetical protein